MEYLIFLPITSFLVTLGRTTMHLIIIAVSLIQVISIAAAPVSHQAGRSSMITPHQDGLVPHSLHHNAAISQRASTSGSEIPATFAGLQLLTAAQKQKQKQKMQRLDIPRFSWKFEARTKMGRPKAVLDSTNPDNRRKLQQQKSDQKRYEIDKALKTLGIQPKRRVYQRKASHQGASSGEVKSSSPSSHPPSRVSFQSSTKSTSNAAPDSHPHIVESSTGIHGAINLNAKTSAPTSPGIDLNELPPPSP
jgi:hypothetical protein